MAVVFAGFGNRGFASDNGTIHVDFTGINMWDCGDPTQSYDYPVGEVTSLGLSPEDLRINLGMGGGAESHSFAAQLTIAADGETQEAIYQFHDGDHTVGLIDRTTGQLVPGSEDQISYNDQVDETAQVVITYTKSISIAITDIISTHQGQLVGVPVEGQIPPAEDAQPHLFIQINTFYQPTPEDVRTCGQNLVYFTTIEETQRSRLDGIQDGVDCTNGVSPYAIPAGVDLTAAHVGTDYSTGLYTFTLDFGRATSLDEQFAGGIEFYDPQSELYDPDAAWFFNTTGNLSFNFFSSPPDSFDQALAIVQDGSWTEVEDAEFEVEVAGNQVVFTIPFDQVPESATGWMATSTNFSVCDQIGLGPEALAVLPVPPRQPPPTATPTDQLAPEPTATALPEATATSPEEPTPTEALQPPEDDAVPETTTDQDEPEPDLGAGPPLWLQIPFCWQVLLIAGFILLLTFNSFFSIWEVPKMPDNEHTEGDLPDPTDFNPYADPFPESPEIPWILEWKFDVVIAKLHDIRLALQWGFGCLIPLLILMLAGIGIVINIVNPVGALVFAVFAYLLYLLLQLIARRFIRRL